MICINITTVQATFRVGRLVHIEFAILTCPIFGPSGKAEIGGGWALPPAWRQMHLHANCGYFNKESIRQ
jgi:hypothetical protein